MEKRADLNEHPNQSRLACLLWYELGPTVHPDDEPIARRCSDVHVSKWASE